MFVLATAAACLGRTGLAHAEDQKTGYLFHYFGDSDHVRVYSHYSDYRLQLENGAVMDLEWKRDFVIFPAVDAPRGSEEAVDAITSASRPISRNLDAFDEYTKRRDEVQAAVGYKMVNAGYYMSSEKDYFAQQVKGSLSRDFLHETLNLSVSSSYAWDEIRPLEDDDTPSQSETKTTSYWNAVVTQIVTPTTVLRVGGELNLVRGLQHNPYRNVYAGGASVPEKHPGGRTRRDIFASLNQFFKNRSSLKVSYRFYTDDWGVDSHTLGLRLSQYVTDDVVVRYRYRYYEQDQAYFHLDDYPLEEGVDGYRTADYRLGAFDAHLFGTRIDWRLGRLVDRFGFLRQPRLNLKYERYFNSNNFSANIFESGIAVNF